MRQREVVTSVIFMEINRALLIVVHQEQQQREAHARVYIPIRENTRVSDCQIEEARLISEGRQHVSFFIKTRKSNRANTYSCIHQEAATREAVTGSCHGSFCVPMKRADMLGGLRFKGRGQGECGACAGLVAKESGGNLYINHLNVALKGCVVGLRPQSELSGIIVQAANPHGHARSLSYLNGSLPYRVFHSGEKRALCYWL